MNLRKVREAAEAYYMHPSYSAGDILKRDCCGDLMTKHILATIDPSPDSPITADWLREAWGVEYVGEMDKDKLYLDHDYSHYMVVMHERVVLFYLDGNPWPCDLTTRQQFCDLASCLGIPRKGKDGVE